MGRGGVRELGDDAHFLVMVGGKRSDQEANAIGSGRCLSVPAQVPGTFGVLDLGCIFSGDIVADSHLSITGL